MSQTRPTPPEPKPSWNELKGKLKKKFPILTDADVSHAFGKKDEMIAKLQVILGKSKDEFQSILNAL